MRSFVVFISFVLSCVSFAQTSGLRFVEAGKEWHVRRNFPVVSDIYYRLDGDTVVGGVKCMKMFQAYGSKPESVWTDCVASLYEDGDKVYCFDSGSNQSYQLYDFGLKVGDVVPHQMEETEVVSVNELRVGDKNIRGLLIVCGSGEDVYEGFWLEGIGSFIGPLYSGVRHPGCYESFESCTLPDDTVINASDIISAMGIDISCLDKTDAADVSTYDLSGRKVTGTPRSGIYIKGGRKVLVK